MEGSSETKTRQHIEKSQTKGKKQKIDIEKGGRTPKRKLNQDLVDQLPGSKPKARRIAQLRANVEKLEDKYKYVGNIWTPIRGYELFMFHYHIRHRMELVCNP